MSQQAKITRDVLSVFRDRKGIPVILLKRGERVTLMADHDNVKIVEDSRGKRHPVNIDSLEIIQP
jgi:hypothetical protein